METPIKTQLEVGDKIVKYYYSTPTLITIDRVTPKRAFSGHTQFDREIKPSQLTADWSLNEIGRNSYSNTSYCIYVQSKHESKILRSKLESKSKSLLQDIKVAKLPNETLEKLIELLTPIA